MKKINKLFLYLVALLVLGNSACVQKTENNWTDQEAMVRALEWQEQHPIFALAPNDWTCGVYYTGVTKAYQSTHDPIFLAALKTMGYNNQWKPCYRSHHADDIAIAYSYLFLNTVRKNLVDLSPTKAWIDTHLFEPNQWNNENNDHAMTKILWWWCDALFMAPPVITCYANESGNLSYLDKMHEYYKETCDLLFDEEEKLFARDTRYVWGVNESDSKEENGKKIFWSRGNGWVIGGLALILNDMPPDYQHRNFYESLYVTMAEKIMELQPDDGLWRVSLLNPGIYDHGEVSGSALFTFALTWGINNGLLDPEVYKPVVRKSWSALRDCQKNDGMIGWVQDIGSDPQPANENSWQNYGTGAFLLAGSEIIKMK